MSGTVRLQRVAASDGVVHVNRPHHAWTLCGIRATAERWGWPITSRCATCSLEAEILLHQAHDAAKARA